jgi:hypothetical protein
VPQKNRSGVHVADQIADAAVETIGSHDKQVPLYMHIAFCKPGKGKWRASTH